MPVEHGIIRKAWKDMKDVRGAILNQGLLRCLTYDVLFDGPDYKTASVVGEHKPVTRKFLRTQEKSQELD